MSRCVRTMLLSLCVAVFVPAGCASIADGQQQASTTSPATTTDDFSPADAELTDCVGLVERPGCGNENRGGALMYTTFAVMVSGLAFIGWRIVRGVRRPTEPA